MLPAATSLITLLPALIPAKVILGPLAMVKPLLLISVSPAFKDLTSKSSAVATM